ncbi:hypothetical protein FEM48_Zijuj12G0082600 [Ziziphus jujuba var. spinosa]|uniref:Uncharacterized protein n=1 Tax=Ziziphus jujuba var. spinosa TaxID=714518 RepID=A0A978UC68_ZIZJJ|nr:hypothetical protein FEM48_Zijuj12G0082600 [Ziziphus jujuba var. spinosa]
MDENDGTPSPPPPTSSESENGNGGDNDGWSQLVSNNRRGMIFDATPELLIMEILRRRVQGSLHRVSFSVLCYFRECHSQNFFELPEYYRRRANLYFCRRIRVATAPAAGGEEVTPAGWRITEGPTAFDNNYGHGRYATYQRISSRVIVSEYRFFPQPPNGEIALYRILAREF